MTNLSDLSEAAPPITTGDQCRAIATRIRANSTALTKRMSEDLSEEKAATPADISELTAAAEMIAGITEATAPVVDIAGKLPDGAGIAAVLMLGAIEVAAAIIDAELEADEQE